MRVNKILRLFRLGDGQDQLELNMILVTIDDE